MTTPYLLRTEPFFQDYLWGGRKLQTALGKKLPPAGVWAESWEVIDHPAHSSRISNGPLAGQTLGEVTRDAPQWLFGSSAKQQATLPLLFKYLDCQKVLSVQVHPNDEYGSGMNPPDLGKTEAWYVVAAEPGAKLYAGLKAGVTADTFKTAMQTGTVEECLHVIEPQAGECVFIPAGTVHALGAGLLIAEIQQASNTTFRLFDWNRVGTDGQPRPLHIDQGLEVIDFAAGPRLVQTPEPTDDPQRERLVHCEKFVLDRLSPEVDCSVGGDERFHLLSAPYGGIQLSMRDGNHFTPPERLTAGQTVLVPACLPGLVATRCEPFESLTRPVLLDMYLP